MNIIGARFYYTGGAERSFSGPPTLAKVAGWPGDGVQVGVLYFDAEVSPGVPYRQIMMGNDSYFYVPSTGVFGHGNESADEIRERYGADTIVWRGQWTTMAEINELSALAMSMEQAP
jgi:hypothetical protein